VPEKQGAPLAQIQQPVPDLQSAGEKSRPRPETFRDA